MQNFLYFLKTNQYPLINIILNSIIILAIFKEIIPLVKYSKIGLSVIILIIMLSGMLGTFNLLQLVMKKKHDTTFFSIMLIGVVGLIAWDITNTFNANIHINEELPFIVNGTYPKWK